MRDRTAGTTRRASVGPDGLEGNGRSVAAAVTLLGRFVAFQSTAADLVPGDTDGATGSLALELPRP